MAMTLEEVLLKLKLDSSTVVQDMNKFKESISQGTQHAHKSFLHAESAGRSFHKLMEKITEQSPLMGTAFKLAMNPVVGTLAAATAAFTFFNKKLDEFNEKMDEMGKANAQPINRGGRTRALEAAATSQSAREYELFHMPQLAGDDWVKEGKGMIDRMPPGPARDALAYSLYMRARRQMGFRMKDLGGGIRQLGNVVREREGVLGGATDTATALKEEIAKLESQAPKRDPKSGFFSTLGEALGFGSGVQQEEERLKNLRRAKEELARIEQLTKNLRDLNIQDNRTIKEKSQEYESLKKPLAAINQSIASMPRNEREDLGAYLMAIGAWRASPGDATASGVTREWQRLQQTRLLNRTPGVLAQAQVNPASMALLVELLLNAVKAEGIPITPGTPE